MIHSNIFVKKKKHGLCFNFASESSSHQDEQKYPLIKQEFIVLTQGLLLSQKEYMTYQHTA